MWLHMFLGLVYCLVSWFYTLWWYESDFSERLFEYSVDCFLHFQEIKNQINCNSSK